ncbi:MAG TPA: EAL domain-containing protein [Methylocystis sp.]|nr:EAL domain-containing protein [Methylocystis sp.]
MESVERPWGSAIAQQPDEARTTVAPSLAPIAETFDTLELCPKERRSQTGAGNEFSVLNGILRQLPVGVWVQSVDGKVVLANDAAAQFDAPGEFLPGAAGSGPVPPQDQLLEATNRDVAVAREKRVVTDFGERTLLIINKSVRIQDEGLVLSTAIDITDSKQAEDKLKRRANFDELTGLPNRFQFEELVKLTLARSDFPCALAFIDIDNFKLVNDYYGHAIGDALLVKISKRISENIRPSDILARIGGDEFLLLIGPLEHKQELLTTINSVSESLKRPFFVEGFEIFTSASIGVSIYPEHGQDFEALRRSADSAMYQIKHDTKGAAAVFEPKFDHFGVARMRGMQRLRLAIQDRRFRCAFQPKVNIYTEEVVGVEALVRLLDEDGEIHAPSSFIDLAHELGVMDEMTQLVIDEIAHSIDLINDAFGPRSTISVNVGAKQASNIDFMHSFIEALKETNCPERFIAEVTEDALVTTSRFQTEVIPMLRKIGVRVSIDDFGTGYSSLSSLADITADEIKIDRSFITNIHKQPRNQCIIKAIESLSNALGMTIVAEGVETFEELAYLRAASHIRYVQGYYFARPLFLEDFKSTKGAAAVSQKTTGCRERPMGRGRVYR